MNPRKSEQKDLTTEAVESNPIDKNESTASAVESKPIENRNIEIDNDLIAQLSDLQEGMITSPKSKTDVTKKQAKEILTKISKTKDISLKTAAIGVAALFRKGAANAGASDSMQVDVLCQDSNVATEISRYDLVMSLNTVTGHKNVRKLAETMAPEMVMANLALLKRNPLLDLKGDLANRINRKLFLRKEPSLTREEEICCCTYTQWMPNLNELALSPRLKGLLEEDLNARRKRLQKKAEKKTK